MKRTITVLSCGAATMFLASAALAQSDELRWNFNVGGGVTSLTGRTSNHLDSGGNVEVGGGYNFTQHLGILGEYQFNKLGVSSRTLNDLNVPDGNAHIWSLTVNPIVRFPLTHRVGAYVIGGGGVYRRSVEFTQPTTDVVNVFDPWWGYVGPALIPANHVLG